MTTFYDLLDSIKDTLDANVFVNTITHGDLTEIDLSKQTIFPLSHFLVNEANYEGNVWRFNISLICMDIEDVSKEEGDAFRGNTNEHDIFNTQLSVINDVLKKIEVGDLRASGYQLDGIPTVEPFTDRYENRLVGWVATFDVLTLNNYSLC